MKRHRFADHSPAEMRRLSNKAHVLEGALLFAVAGLALVANAGLAAWAAAAWPVLVALAGLILLVVLYPFHPVYDWPAIWRDPQQRQHTLMAVILVAAGAAQLGSGAYPWLAFAWPLALALLGLLFLSHTQHGLGPGVEKAVREHRVLGALLIATGLLAAAGVLEEQPFFALLWPLVAMTAAARLVIYREPPEAYESGHEHPGGEP